jgi:hypothetical protein
MADIFTKMLMKVVANSQITGLMQNMGGIGIISMQYVNDTLFER